LRIRILAINEWGQESGNSIAVSERTLPLLQDVNTNGDGRSDTWQAWNAQWRDLVIVDAHNRRVGWLNLSTFDLEVPANYASLKQALIDTAAMSLYPPTPTCQAADVNDNGSVTTGDFRVFGQALGSTVTPGTGADLDRDGRVTIRDLIRIRPFLGQSCSAPSAAAVVAVTRAVERDAPRSVPRRVDPDAIDAVFRGLAEPDANRLTSSRGTASDRSQSVSRSPQRPRLLAGRRATDAAFTPRTTISADF
jgi:hypothetical protein